MIHFSVSPHPSLEKWGFNIGRASKEKASKVIDKKFRSPSFRGKVNTIILSHLADAVNRINALNTKIPVYTGAFISALFGGWFSDIAMAISEMELIQPSGWMARHRYHAKDRNEKITEWVQRSNAKITTPRLLNTGGALNPNFAVIWNEQFKWGNELPPYYVNIEYSGWSKTESYPIHAGMTAIMKEMVNRSMEEIRKLI